MQFRRSGQRDTRRRRVLTDVVLGRAPTAGREKTRSTRQVEQFARKSEHYGDAEFMDEQLRLTDLIPRRLITFVVLFVMGLLIVAGLEALYAWMPRLAELTTDGRVAAFDLDGEGSLAVWFSSTTLSLAALVAVIVYTVRRYKTDDYSGQYRVWLWAAMCWLLLSFDETASLHEGFKEMMAHLTGTRLFGDGSIWWVVPYAFLLGAVGMRLLLDMRPCRLSSTAFVGVAVCYVVAVAAQLEWVLSGTPARAIMLEEGAEMVGNLLLLLAMGLHARYVILDAEGLLPQQAQQDEDEEDEYDEEEDELEAENAILFGQSIRVHAPRTGRTPAARSSRPDSFTAGMQQAETSAGRKLTKQEKKALRKRLLKERLRRQGRKIA
jgi:uncharacterized membrane protein